MKNALQQSAHISPSLPHQVRIRFFVTIIVFMTATVANAMMTTYYRGYVKDSTTQKPVGGVVVTHPGDYFRDTTDSNGYFRIGAISEVRCSPARSGPVSFSVRSGMLSLQLDKRSNVKTEVFTLAGRQLLSQSGMRDPGTHDFSLQLPASGMYIGILAINGNRTVFRLNTSGNCGNIPVRAISGSGAIMGKKSVAQVMVADTFAFSRPGYHNKLMTLEYNLSNDVLLKPVVLSNGVAPGVRKLGSGQGTEMLVYVNENRTLVDSVAVTVKLYCISTSHDFKFSIPGPFSIPGNGVVTVGDSMVLSFTDTSLAGSFTTKQAYSMETSPKCEWTEQYISGGTVVNKMMEHYTHFFKPGTAVGFFDTYYYLTINTEHATMKLYPDKPFYLPGETVQLTAVPDSLYGLRGWSGVDSTSSELIALVKMNCDRTVEARFGVNYGLSLTANGGHFVKIPDKRSYVPGDTVKLIAFPDNLYYFKSWGEGVDSTRSDTAWVIMNQSRNVSAQFGRLVELSINHLHGSIDNDPPNFYYRPEESDTVRLIARPDSGYVFLGWEGDTLKTSGNTTYTVMDRSRTLTAQFISDRAKPVCMGDSTCDIQSVALSPDNTLAAIGSKGSIRIIDTRNGLQIKTIACDGAEVSNVKFSNDGKRLLFSVHSNGCRLWDLEADSTLVTFKAPGFTDCCSFMPNDTMIATGSWDNVVVWSSRSGLALDTFPSDMFTDADLAVSPDGASIATASWSDSTRLYSLSARTVIPVTSSGGIAVKFNQTSDTLMVMPRSGGRLLFVDVKSSAIVDTLEISGNPFCMVAAFSSDGSLVACGTSNRGIFVYDINKQSKFMSFDYPISANAIAFAKDGSSFITGHDNGLLLLWKVK